MIIINSYDTNTLDQTSQYRMIHEIIFIQLFGLLQLWNVLQNNFWVVFLPFMFLVFLQLLIVSQNKTFFCFSSLLHVFLVVLQLFENILVNVATYNINELIY